MSLPKKLFYLFTPVIGGTIVGLLIKNHINYGMLYKPPLSPPSFIFPVMWTIIYILLGISYYKYKTLNVEDKNLDMIYYGGLIVNYLWSIIFFIFKLRLLSCLWIIILDILVVLLMRAFNKYNNISSRLNIPYLVWCLFATYLTIGIYLLN